MNAAERLRRWMKLAQARATLLAQREKEHAEVLDEAVKVEADRNRLARRNERLRREVRYLRRKLKA